MEQIKLKRSRISFFYNYLLSFFLLIFMISFNSLDFSETSKKISTFVCSSLILILLMEPEVERSYRYYLIEESAITKVEGLLNKRKITVPYDQITSVELFKTPIGRIFKFGDVKVFGVKDEILLKGARYPDKIHALLEEKIKIFKKKSV
ncbi:MAG: PH domain-containing protein [Candidatus Aenigmatarchaeota archaeon]